ncbi:energy-coupled thiamine transporter ThiT [Clostridium carnis]
MVILVGIISVLIILLYFIDLKRNRLSTKTMVITAMFSAIAYILYLIQFIKYPQGGGITLFSTLPIMLIGILFGRTAGVTGGLIFGLFKLLNGAMIVHPVQFLLDYILGSMALGVSDIFGTDSKGKIISGCFFASMLSVLFSIISGVIFFAQYAPVGMNPWIYSFIYNFTSAGVEGIITTAVVALIPIKRLMKISNVN